MDEEDAEAAGLIDLSDQLQDEVEGVSSNATGAGG